MRNNKNYVRILVEAGVLIGLALVLDYIKLFTMPQGGSVTAGSMIPILIFAFRWGPGPGFFVGLVMGTMQFILGPKWSFHWVSILFDYSIAWAFLGVAGFFAKNRITMMAGVFSAVTLRFIAHVISGVVVWASYAPEGMSPLWYSITYNGTYLGVEMIIAMVIFWFLSDKLTMYLKRQ